MTQLRQYVPQMSPQRACTGSGRRAVGLGLDASCCISPIVLAPMGVIADPSRLAYWLVPTPAAAGTRVGMPVLLVVGAVILAR